MKKSVAYLYMFIVFMLLISTIIVVFIYPNLQSSPWRVSIASFGFLASILFLLSWTVVPGYITKRAEGEFILILNKFDPKTLCPFCEVVKVPQSKHCYACNKCVEEFDHHCYWINNCVGKRNQYIFLSFILSLSGFLTNIILVSILSNYFIIIWFL